MEIVVLRSDIARLVLGYLKNEQLVRASRVFCKTSPHLRQEFSAYKQGLQTYSFFPDLEEIICEYVKITRKVDQLLPGLPNTCRTQLQHRKLSDKVAALLERAVQTETYLGASVRGGAANQANSSAGKGSVQSDKENNTKRRSELQRKRKNDSLLDSPEEQRKSTSTAHVKKRRRVLEPFCYLSSKSEKRKKETELSISYSSADDLTHSEENCEDDEFEGEVEEEEATSEAENEHDVDDISLMEKPTKESTPRNKVAQHSTPPSLPEISQAILDNPEFQLKLVQNINQALLTTTSHSNSFNAAVSNHNAKPPNAEHPPASVPAATELNDEQNTITSNQLLDQMVKDILEATERDPTFDAIIEEVIGASNKSLVSAAVQCDMGEAACVVSGFATEVHNSEAVPPSTPLVIRTAVDVASAAPNATLTANTSFGSLIDPNFSISKLIVLNSNDSAQKQPPEQSIGNTTADQLINQLTSSNADCAMDDQVYFDPTTGQLTFPLFLTNDGLLTNFPFLINNEVVTQQLQPSNVANLEASRIEIPLAEPIVVSADQLPPNSIILGSAQKVGGDLEQQLPPSTLLKTETGVSTAIFSAVPSSLDSRIHIGRATPSGSGIFNGKACRSLSTPRKRASHVRTLTFSPRSTVAPITHVGATPLSTRKQSLSRLRRVPENIPETSAKPEVLVPEKPIIKIVEALPPIAAVTIEASCNESSNSCNVPPLFASEESSNLTVIKGICSDKVVPISKLDRKESQVFNADADTPKRKQPRRTAVRACKRQLSKSSNEDELERDQQGIEEVNAKGIKIIAPAATSKENQGNIGSCLQQDQEILVEHIKEEEDKLLQEWQRMRSATSSDLDTRLRELNAKLVHSRPQKKEIKKKVRRKKAVDRKKKNSDANASVVEADRSEEAVHNIETEKDTIPVVGKIKMERKTKGCTASSAEEKQRQTKGKKKQIKERPKEFSVKIPTPQKSTNEKLKQKHDGTKGIKDKSGNDKILIASAKPTADVEQPTAKAEQEGLTMELGLKTQRVFQMPVEQSVTNHIGQALTQGQGRQTVPHEDFECEKRTANIACLLDTPFKDVNTSVMVPPTPGCFAPSLDTPLSKVRPSSEHEAMHSSSFLFGSLTKSEQDTPMLSAITPGFRFTPFGSRDATPRSVTATEYSSGGSYYKPDESDDLDKNIDRLLRDSTQKKQEEPRQPQQFDEQDVKTPQSIKASVAPPALTAVATEAGKSICVEIPVEKLKVEPIVLKRVKSFSSGAVDSAEPPASKIDPHYTLISGLPDISAEEAESSSSSSSSSSSNASNSSSDDDSSTSSSSAAGTSPTSQSVILGNESKTPQKAYTSLSLENLSEISSTEDEEWQRLVVTEGENSQLVSNDGEVRYPVRSWLTPSKQQAELLKMATIRVTLPLKSAEKHKQRETATELEQKRERMKEKLRLDSQHKATSLSPANAPCISAALATTRKLQAMRDKPKRSGATPPSLKPAPPEEKRTIDVLTALHLSAKKQPPASGGVALTPAKLATSPPAMPSPGDIDDNAVSNIFVNAAEPETKANADNVPLKKLFSTAKAGPRKCLQIESRPAPAPAQSRATAKQKKIVRTPLDFKSSATTGLLVSSSASTAAKVSPLPKIKITPSAGTTASGSNLRVSPRLNKGKKVTKRAVVGTDKRSKYSLPTKPKANAKKNIMETTAKAAHNVTKRIQSGAVTTAKADKKPLTKANNKVLVKDKPKCQEKKEVHNKTAISCATAAAVVEDVAVIEATALPIVPAVPGPVQNSTKQPTALVEGPEEDDDEEEDDNCELVSISEVDAKRFIYNGPDDEPKEAPAKHDFSNFKMVVAIDEHERHTWQVTDAICLYTSPPQQLATVPAAAAATTQLIRNIPKKRKIRITTTSTSDETETARVVPTVPASATTTIPAAIAKEPEKESAAETAPQVSEQPVASSTPLTTKTGSSATIVETPAPSSRRAKASVQRNKAANTKALVEISSIGSSTFSAQSNVLTAKSTLPTWSSDTISTATKTITTTTEKANANANEAEKIQIEDIESILSHLHGT